MEKRHEMYEHWEAAGCWWEIQKIGKKYVFFMNWNQRKLGNTEVFGHFDMKATKHSGDRGSRIWNLCTVFVFIQSDGHVHGVLKPWRAIQDQICGLSLVKLDSAGKLRDTSTDPLLGSPLRVELVWKKKHQTLYHFSPTMEIYATEVYWHDLTVISL